MHEYHFIIFADFESVLQKTNLNKMKKSNILHNHIPSVYSMIIIINESEIFYCNTYCGQDCINVLMKNLKRQSFKINEIQLPARFGPCLSVPSTMIVIEFFIRIQHKLRKENLTYQDSPAQNGMDNLLKRKQLSGNHL